MTIIYEGSYTLPAADEPLTHARMAHAGNWRTDGTSTPSSTATGYSADAPNNTLAYEKWKPSAMNATWEVDFGAPVELDYCCIAAHNLGDTGCSIRIHYWDGAAWVAKTPVTAITSNEPIMCIFEPFSAQIWRVSITVGTAPEIGVIKFGIMLQFPQAMFAGHTPINYARKSILRGNTSETGEPLGRTVQRTSLVTSYNWEHLDYSWIAANWATAQTAIESEAFFLAWRPSKDSVVAFGQVDETPAPNFMGIKDRMSLAMTVRARSYD